MKTEHGKYARDLCVIVVLCTCCVLVPGQATAETLVDRNSTITYEVSGVNAGLTSWLTECPLEFI